MSDVAELKRFVVVHARGQRIRGYRAVLDRIGHDGEGTGSWVAEWCRAGAEHERRGRLLDACRHYAMARFPYPDGPARAEAGARCADAFDRWRAGSAPFVERLDVALPGGTVRCWATGLSPGGRRPVLVTIGGIVTVKEQWAPVLSVYRRLGFAAIAAELPGVGENPLRYGADGWRLLPALLDTVADRADADRAYPVALSFAGHLALRAAVEDRRIRAVLTTGAPVRGLFADRQWQARLPRITVDTLAHLTGGKPATLPDGLADWALTDEQLAALDIPVAYVASTRDEIIPASDVELLRTHLWGLRVREHDDVHGAPAHVADSQLWLIRSVLKFSGARDWRARAVDLMWQAQRARRRLARQRA